MIEQKTSSRFLGLSALFIVLLMSSVECAFVERKYGLFSGGFLVSRYLDTLSERIWFFAGYAISQSLLAVVVWILVRDVLRVERPLLKLWSFAFFFGAAMAFTLAVKFQLASYFGDAVSFALIKQLGGGSIVDSIKFGFSEGVSTAIAFGLTMLVYAGGTWFLAKHSIPLIGPSRGFRWRWPLSMLTLALVSLGLTVPRLSGDASVALMRTVSWGGLNAGLSKLTDFDGDGFGLFSTQYDTHPFSASEHPFALDIPGNGIDEDGLGGDLVLIDVPKQLDSFSVMPNPPHVVLVIMESTRGDVVGKKLGGRLVAPNLTQLANSGSWTRAYSHVGFTVESLKSIFTGALVPRVDSPSLFVELKAAGYTDGVISGQPEDFGGISEATGMQKSASVLVDANVLKDRRASEFAAKGSLRVDEKHLMETFDQYFGNEASWSKPNFLYFNFQSPHFPYHHEEIPAIVTDHPLPRDQISAENRDAVAATYWNSVAYSDRWLGVLVARLKALGVWENTLLLVSGDHGEELFEQSFLGHGHIINERQNQTFLVANRPGVVPGRPVALSEYRAIVAQALGGPSLPSEGYPPFMYIGSINRPAQIGMLNASGQIVSLSTESGVACFEDGKRCQSYDSLNEVDWNAVNEVVRRWGSERWKVSNAR